MLADLSIPWPVNDYSIITREQFINLKNRIIVLEELQYTHIVINFIINIHEIKIPSNNINPILNQLENFNKFDEFIKRGIKFFTRITIIIEHPNQGQNLSKFYSNFNIISILPKTEKALILACGNLDIDIITFDYNFKIPFFLKHKTIGGGIKKGIKFEICYSSLLSLNSIEKQCFINNFLQLVRSSRNQNLIVSSNSENCLKLRNFNNILNFLKNLGFKDSKILTNVEKVLLNSTLRLKSYKQTIMIGEDPINETNHHLKNPIKRHLNEIDNGEIFKIQLKKLKQKNLK
ncbi:hypothetical protein WICMUC_002110 [Wickerhamomyces mucosus]|uniref:Uncharacterized protein n=1 Tax=Wickerhamomyces mucosus TaxID=1378264 RepID=A0A9P8PRT8_9ASCO|nr:hypothetical protein WICMUC_002110 [Wickerhamomyces mucosus]